MAVVEGESAGVRDGARQQGGVDGGAVRRDAEAVARRRRAGVLSALQRISDRRFCQIVRSLSTRFPVCSLCARVAVDF